MNKPTLDDLDRGYSECYECAEGVHIHQAGYDVQMHVCAMCKCHVADKTEFFNAPMELMSK